MKADLNGPPNEQMRWRAGWMTLRERKAGGGVPVL